MAGALLCLIGTAAHAATTEGTIHIVVHSQPAVSVAHASVFISNKSTRHLVVMDDNGSLTVRLPEGSYQIFSAMGIQHGDSVDRFASVEATVNVAAGDQSSVALLLKELPELEPQVELSTLRKIGVDPEHPELTKDLN